MAPPLILRCGGAECELSNDQYACLRWAWSVSPHISADLARMFIVGGRFERGALEQIGDFVTAVRGWFAQSLVLEPKDSAVAVINRLGLVYALRGGSDRFRTGVAVPPGAALATLGDVRPLVEAVALLDGFCRRARSLDDVLVVERSPDAGLF